MTKALNIKVHCLALYLMTLGVKSHVQATF